MGETALRDPKKGAFSSGNKALVEWDKIETYASGHAAIGSRHVTSSPFYEIEPSGPVAHGVANTSFKFETRIGFKLAFTGYNSDVLKLHDGRWMIAFRWATQDGPGDDPSCPILTSDPETKDLAQIPVDGMKRLGSDRQAPVTQPVWRENR